MIWKFSLYKSGLLPWGQVPTPRYGNSHSSLIIYKAFISSQNSVHPGFSALPALWQPHRKPWYLFSLGSCHHGIESLSYSSVSKLEAQVLINFIRDFVGIWKQQLYIWLEYSQLVDCPVIYMFLWDFIGDNTIKNKWLFDQVKPKEVSSPECWDEEEERSNLVLSQLSFRCTV